MVNAGVVNAARRVQCRGGMASTVDPALQLEAESDVYRAVMRLGDMCEALRLEQGAWTRETLLAFVEQAKQRLNVVATAAPFVP